MCPYFCTNTGVFIHFLHLPENDTVLPLSASCYLPMYLHQIVLLPYQSSPVVVCLLVCSVEIMNTLQHIQVLSTCKCVEEKKKECKKKKRFKKNANLKMGLQMCMTFKSSMKSHCSPACDHFYMYAKVLASRWRFGNLIYG